MPKKVENYVIIREYAQHDPEFLGDETCVMLQKDGQTVLSGDYYHNHIDDQIKGYLKAVEHITGKKPKTTSIERTSEDY